MPLNKDSITYSDRDPRYGFTIMDSDEYNTRIHPFDITEKCKKRTRSRDPTLVADCASQRYENCVTDPLENVDTRCDIKLRTNTPKGKKMFYPKKLNTNSIHSKTRLSKVRYPNVVVDYAPDPRSGITSDEPNSLRRVRKDDDDSEVIEHCVGLGVVQPNPSCSAYNKVYEPVMKGCCPWCPTWVTPEDSCSLSFLLCLLCICLPCIMSCIRSL